MLELQHSEFCRLNTLAQNIVQHLEEDHPGVASIQTALEDFSQRWDSIVQQMEDQSKVVSIPKLKGVISENMFGIYKHPLSLVVQFSSN